MRSKTLLPFQDKFVFSPKRYTAFVGGWASGKTMCGILRGIRLSEENPNNLGLICRKEYTDLRDSTLKDFFDLTGLRPDSNKEIRLGNGSVIMFRHADELDALQNINLGWVFIEQGEEFETADRFDFLKGRLRRQEAESVHMFITANTNGHNWIYERFKVSPVEDYELVEATTYDNAINLRPDFIPALERDLRITQPKMFKRYVLNSWEDADVSDQAIPESFIRPCVKNPLFPLRYREDDRRVVGCDPARFGDDRTVIYGLKGGEKVACEVHNQVSGMETAGYISKVGQEIGASVFGVESTGIGAGPVDRLIELGKRVIAIEPGSKSNYPERFYNLKAEITWNAREMFEKREVSIDDDEELISELSAIRYRMSSDQKIRIEAKDEIKKRLGKSPDKAEAFNIALYVLRFANPSKETDGGGLRRLTERVGRMRSAHTQRVGW